MRNYFDSAIGIAPGVLKLTDIRSKNMGNIGYVTQAPTNLGVKNNNILTVSPLTNYQRRY
tara:strand:+ start:1478 stop:1657 length:180 start_codon:yes stop_codon:yes gene_type:complete